MGYETLDFRVDERVAIVTLNRPQMANAINRQMHRELTDAWQTINREDGIWCAVVAGAGRDFSVGDDLDEMASTLKAGTLPEDWHSAIHWQESYRGLGAVSGIPDPVRGFPGKPLIAAIHGKCQNSALVMACHADFVIADETATFGLPMVQAGLAPLDEVVVLSRLIARGPAVRLALLGENDSMDAQRAYELGLVVELQPAGGAFARALELAKVLNDWSSPVAVRGSKAAIFSTYNLPYDKAQLMSHVFLNQVRFHTEDAKEGPRAFAEKRKPEWKAR